jgi:uncharacterized protein YndB with AHSA1/START domain
MAGLCLDHETLVFEKAFPKPIHTLFASFADPKARARWGVPSKTAAIIDDETDFRIGGRDLSRCGARNDPRWRGHG